VGAGYSSRIRAAVAQPFGKSSLRILVVLILVFTTGKKNRDHATECDDYSKYGYDNFHD
jgi:hypothetical protein